MARKITGRIEVYVNGDLLLNKPGSIASGIGQSGAVNFERAEVLGDNGVHGFVETPVVAQLEVTITDVADVNLNSLALIDGDGTVIFRAARSGKEYTMGNATCTKNFSVTGGEGETTVVFKGETWVESTR